MKITVGLIFLTSFVALGQESNSVKAYHAGFTTLKLADRSRMYKPNTAKSDSLYYLLTWISGIHRRPKMATNLSLKIYSFFWSNGLMNIRMEKIIPE
jgi:hypothetical protein